MQKKQKALFLDRDGVINIEKNYLYKKEDFKFIDGIFSLCLFFQSLDYQIFVVTNQSGIARGYYTQEQFLELSSWMKEEFLKHNICISDVYFCPHHPDITGECSCRKPKAGMLYEAAREYNIDLSQSVMIGDKQRDIDAGINAGVAATYLFDPNDEISQTNATYKVSKLEDIMDLQC